MTADYQKARENMVDCQIHTAGVLSPGLLQSFMSVPRELFVPDKMRGIAYSDGAVALGKGRFMIECMTLAKLLQAVRLEPSDMVLDVGAGTGYSSAILSPLVMSVVALDDKKTLEKAARNWEKLGCPNIIAAEGELRAGAPAHAPYSLILLNGAVDALPQNLLGQLAPGGRLAGIVKRAGETLGCAVLAEKLEGGHISSRSLFEADASYLPGFAPSSAFVF
ncbi:MAG: protein-L-isoaspartate O-methyltransferase [Alphaproteobacteria bacterium]|jgi:protein-L-isoaspartate(D-aspartate) O-methyltransferase|nr:protein-L-isoaspartate O-methyltransferase [Alphaproteobacteria bacterium]QQS56451.1 MAG: protein-L-isoaspartate O-methyltransferase [Alphaproteobacteria bacterium]